MNYYSPVPAAPAFVEVAVTSYTQVCYSNISLRYVLRYTVKNGCSLFCVLEQRADRETLLSQQQGWFFNGSDGNSYVAPHPPFQVTSYDLDGHQMSQVPNPFLIEPDLLKRDLRRITQSFQ
jgi:hypothetical protein